MKAQVPATQDLIPVQQIDVPTLFTSQKAVAELLSAIEKKAKAHEPDLSTATSRKEIASNAHKVAQSKTFLDGLGKQFVADRKAEIKVSDSLRKSIRDHLDGLKATVREPLTQWENEEKERIAREKAHAEFLMDWEDALAENELIDRQREIERREAELAQKEAERRAREEAEQLERERKEREARIAQEAAEKAKKEAEEKALREKQESERREREAKEAAERAEAERIAAEKQAEIDKQKAVEAEKERAAREAERREQERLEKEKAQKEADERRARHHAHRKKINREALACFVENGFDDTVGKSIIELIATGKIKHIEIKY